MLSQALLRGLRPAAQASRPSFRQPLPSWPSTTSARSYAKYKTKTPLKAPVSPSKSSTSSASGAARQTSPGTTLPKDKTWKPKDSIKFGDAAAATSAATAAIPKRAGGVGDSSTAQTGEFNAAADPAVNTVPEGQPGPTPETALPTDPTPNTTRDSEEANIEFIGTQSAEANTQASEKEPLEPLPDLRQGIPSTFDAEFGLGRGAKDKKASAAQEAEEEFDITSPEGVSSGTRPRRGSDDYSQSDYETSTDRRRAKFANYMYASFALLGITGFAYFSRPYGDDDEVPSGLSPSDISSWSPGAMYTRAKSRTGGSLDYYTEPTSRSLLPDIPEAQRPAYTLVLSLEDLLIHSEWTREHGWRTAKRPGVDYFLRYLSQYYELVVFTTVPSAMGDPVLKKLDPFRVVMWPLFREATKYEKGKYIKDLAYLNRPLNKTIMIDTKVEHAANQPENAIILPKWTGNPKDSHARDLVALIPFLEYIGTMGIEDTRKVLESFKDTDIPTEFARRESIAREKFNEQLAEERARRPKKSIGGLLNSALGMKPQPGGMTFDNETSVAQGLAEGKMLSDQIRERGQREYERLENEIRTNGAKWLKDMEEEEKRFMESSMKDMRKSWFGSFGGGSKES